LVAESKKCIFGFAQDLHCSVFILFRSFLAKIPLPPLSKCEIDCHKNASHGFLQMQVRFDKES
jgi:hypothetical protein